MKKSFAYFFSLLLILVFVFSSFGESILLNDATKVANLQIRVQKKFWNWQDRSISKANELKENNKKLAYIFDLAPEGCIVVSTDTTISPVIAFTDKGKFSLEDTPDNVLLQLIKKDISKRLSAIPSLSLSIKKANTKLWSDYLTNGDSIEQLLGDAGVWGPWLTTTWTQLNPYNKYCPIDPNTGNRSVVGCVATATAQICNYWQYPTSISFNWNNDHYISEEGGVSQVRIDEDSVLRSFLSFTQLNSMLSVIDYSNSDDISALCFACGIVVNMDYTSTGSGAYTDVPAYNRFGYRYIFKSGDSPDFYDALEDSMKSGKPAQLSIFEEDGGVFYSGHSIVADGFRTSWNGNTGEYYHLNFGWGSSSPASIANCWYLLPTGMPAGYNFINDATMNIQPGSGTPATIYVSTSGNDSTGDGSLANPYLTIQRGIDIAFKGCTVIVLDGTYTGSGNVNLNLYGKGITVKSLNGPANCIIDCANASGTYAFTCENEEGTDAIIEGFTMKRANTDYGGGVACWSSSPIIRGNVFTENAASLYGGAVFCVDSSAIITNNTFTYNTSNRGGAIVSHTASPNITNNTLVGNSATNSGGGIYCYKSSSAIIDANIVRGNQSYWGGGIFIDNSSLTATNNAIVANTSPTGYGGGFYIGNCVPTIMNCTVVDNSALLGCGIYSYRSDITVKNSIFWNKTREAYLSNSIDKIRVSYSDIRGAQQGISGSGTIAVWGDGNINSDPLFIDSANRNYHLKNNSPCLGKGTNSGIPAIDLEGNPRPNPVGTNCDMGAYEDMRSEPSTTKVYSLLKGWNLLSCPGVPVISDINIIKSGNTNIGAMIIYDEIQKKYMLTTTIIFGKSYFIAALNNTQITIEYYPRSSLTLIVKKGWNPLGSISGSVLTGSIISDPIGKLGAIVHWNYDTKKYEVATTIEPGVGYMLAGLGDCTLTMSCSPSAPSNNQKPMTEPLWEGLLSIKAQADYEEFAFGMNKSASNEIDPYDEPIPPSPNTSEILNAGWVLGDKSFELLKASFVRDASKASWDLSVKLLGNGEIKWSNLPNTYRFTLLYNNQVIDMRSEHSLSLSAGEYFLKVLANTYDDIPNKMSLLANYPNPFNPETWIPYELSKDTNVEVMIYTLDGKLVRRLDLGYKLAGRYTDQTKAIYWNGKNDAGENVSSGVYFYTLTTPEFSQTRKLLILR